MGLYLFRLPDVGEGVAEAEIGAWHVKAGDAIHEDQPLVDVMTDKASVEITSPVTGQILAVHGAVGDFMPVGGTIVEIEVEGAGNAKAVDTPAPKIEPVRTETPAPLKAPEPKSEPVAAKPAPIVQTEAFTTRGEGEAPLASPATRRRAFDMGIALQFVPGTGPGGRITSDDLDAYIASGGQKARPAGSGHARASAVHEIRIVGMRRKIAEKMQEAKRRIPHFSYVEEFDMTALEALRKELNASRTGSQPKLSLLPFFMRAIVTLRAEFPSINARYDDEAGVLHQHEPVHIGIATQTGAGLMVPVVRHVEALDLWQCAEEMGRVTQAARDGRATREELSGSTITLTSLGTLGGIAATPVINAPEVAILGPNKLVERPVVRDGLVVVRTMMNLSTSFDHRIVDGYDAALYVSRMKRLIEHPALLFVGRS